jgi:hypothetical protein
METRMPLSLWAVIVLATAYLSHVIINENGPFYLFLWLRKGMQRLGDHLLQHGWVLPGDMVTSLHEMLTCPICLPFWVALILFRLAAGVWMPVEALAVAALCVARFAIWQRWGNREAA